MKNEVIKCTLLVIAEILCVIAIARCCCSCTPKTLIVEKVAHDTLQVQKIQRDSIYLHDSVFTTIYGRNDTIFQTTYKLRDRWCEKIIRDTMRIVKCDSIPIPVKVTKEVNRLYWWQKLFMNIGILAIVIIGILTFLKLKK